MFYSILRDSFCAMMQMNSQKSQYFYEDKINKRGSSDYLLEVVCGCLRVCDLLTFYLVFQSKIVMESFHDINSAKFKSNYCSGKK